MLNLHVAGLVVPTAYRLTTWGLSLRKDGQVVGTFVGTPAEIAASANLASVNNDGLRIVYDPTSYLLTAFVWSDSARWAWTATGVSEVVTFPRVAAFEVPAQAAPIQAFLADAYKAGARDAVLNFNWNTA